MTVLDDLRRQLRLLEQKLGILRLEVELREIKEKLAQCQLGPQAATPQRQRRGGGASPSPSVLDLTSPERGGASGTSGMDVDTEGEGAAALQEGGEGEATGFPHLTVAKRNDIPLKELLEMPLGLMYLSIKLSQNSMPSFGNTAGDRKKKMYLNDVVRMFDLFSTKEELDSYRMAKSQKDRTGDHRASIELVENSVRLLFATIFKDISKKVPPNLQKAGGKAKALTLSSIHTLQTSLESDHQYKLHDPKNEEQLRAACLEFRADQTTYERAKFVVKVNKKQKAFGPPLPREDAGGPQGNVEEL